MGKSGSSNEGGYNASQFMYGFIFLMYAITAAVLFYVMANRRERKKKREEAKAKESEAEVIDSGIEMLKEKQDELEKTAKLTGKGGSDEKEDLQETTFENPTVEDIKQLQEEPKKLKDKKSE